MDEKVKYELWLYAATLVVMLGSQLVEPRIAADAVFGFALVPLAVALSLRFARGEQEDD